MTSFDIAIVAILVLIPATMAVVEAWRRSRLRCHYCAVPLSADRSGFCSDECEDEFNEASLW